MTLASPLFQANVGSGSFANRVETRNQPCHVSVMPPDAEVAYPAPRRNRNEHDDYDRQRLGTGAAPRLQPGLISASLEADGVIQRQGDRFPLDKNRGRLFTIFAARALAITRARKPTRGPRGGQDRDVAVAVSTIEARAGVA